MYVIPAAHVRVTGVFSHTQSLAPYRGNGRPEAIYLLERLLDDAARELGVDRVELRRRNLIPRLPAVQDRDHLHLRLRRIREGHGQGARALGLDRAFRDKTENNHGRKANCAASASPMPSSGPPRPAWSTPKSASIPRGSGHAAVGTKSQGQGHETMYRQIAASRLGLAPEELRFIDGDTDAVAYGAGTGGSRSAAIGGTALWLAADKVIAKGKRIAAHLLEAADADIAFADGRFTIAGTDRGAVDARKWRAPRSPSPTLPRGMEPGLFEHATFAPVQETFPNGTHVCEVEVDPETGTVELRQLRGGGRRRHGDQPAHARRARCVGGIVQGLGQILMEQIVYDADGPAAHRLVHGLRHAARRRHLRLRGRPQPGADAS